MWRSTGIINRFKVGGWRLEAANSGSETASNLERNAPTRKSQGDFTSDFKSKGVQRAQRSSNTAKRSSNSAQRSLRIIIAGGGTGGHLFPGIAIAQEFQRRHAATRIIFVSTGNPLERSVLAKVGFELDCISAAGIKGRGMWHQLKSTAKIPIGILESMRIIKKFGPHLAVGLGSYSAGPVIIGAWLLRIPTAVHEQNILPGITNRILARFAKRIYISFEATQSRLKAENVLWTGNPVRRELLAIPDRRQNGSHNLDGRSPFTILIIGGSQGAHRINLAVMEALQDLQEKENLDFIHQTGAADAQMVEEAYRENQIRCTVQPFFDNMAELYSGADLLICRAGATTVAEITALGKAAIFIPFPYAADDHQVFNAGSLAEQGAAEMITEKNLNGKILSEKIAFYAANSAALKNMATRARRFGKPDAAERIVDDCYKLVDELTR
jgi:UDP-N-acetylglucosamine--N-acetylmuramyl-(pentapeptide) pyrophosphoryl-undecaprenol N-acetylglucosamine transferase